MTINFTELNDTQKMEAADLIQKIESLDGALADVQTERATAEVDWVVKEEEIKAEKNKMKENMRNIRKATVEKV